MSRLPLDPIFVERARTHRAYLISTALEQAKAFFLRPKTTTVARPKPAPAADPKATSPKATGPKAKPSSPTAKATTAAPRRKKTRAQHRKAARNWDKKEFATVGVPGPELRIEEHTIPVAGFPDVRIRLYHPPTADGDQAVPAVLSFFGGAFRIGGIDYPTTDAGFRRRAADAGVVIAAVDYALAPEHRYPTQLEQAHAALEWLFAQATTLGIDTGRIAVAGVSAGGSIAAALTLANRERGRLPIRLQLLEVPVTDLTGGHIDLRPVREMGIPRIFAIKELRSVAKTYLLDRRQAKEPHASPLLARSHADLPRAVILTAEYDPLRGDGAAYLAALRADGVDASGTMYLGATHDTPIFGGVLPAARRWHDDVVTALRSLHDAD
ncbi:alpha/beta hydrolase fold domain-containing protein [uncultured Plantibacter sp.]|uniref:alpha/beta hydrolase n=1 Tax=uncultured Plantibacter sp. TaxID=293337 RepID=UPI0028D84DE5|nr:alpha/beta hydrolase fold domain-containing protein [uncultured Plantibacter sp.]